MPEDPDIYLSIYVNLPLNIHISVNDNVTVYYYSRRSNHNSLYGYFNQNKDN